MWYVGSDDLKHDVSLEISGDFGKGEAKKYAKWLAKVLNDYLALRSENERLREVVEAAKAIRPALEADPIGKTLASCTDLLCDFGLCVALRELDAALKKLEEG